MATKEWRSEKRNKDGSVKNINGKLYARIQYTDEVSGKRKEILRRVESRTDARKAVREMRKELIDRGPKSVRSDRLAFIELAKRYEEAKLIEAVYSDGKKVTGRRSLKPLKSALKSLIEYFGHQRIRDIRTSDLESYKIRRLRTPVTRGIVEHPRKIASVNRELQLLRAIFNFAKSDKLLIESPFDNQKVISMAAETERDRVLSTDEERRLLNVCIDKRSHLRPLIITAVDTAMRRGELFKLCWRDVDFDNRIITIQATNTKTEKTRFVGMTHRVKEELTRLWEMSPKEGEVLVFGITDSIKKSWKTACRLANIENLHFHDLRHTATTRLIRANVPQSEAMKMTGHTQSKTFQRYMNLTNESVTAASDALDIYNRGQLALSVDVQIPIQLIKGKKSRVVSNILCK